MHTLYKDIQDVHFCWVVRGSEDLLWFKDELHTISSSDVGEQFHFHLYVTGSRKESEAGEDATHYLASGPGVGADAVEVEVELPSVNVAADTLPQQSKGSAETQNDGVFQGISFKVGRPIFGELFGPAINPPHAALLACGPSSMLLDAQRAASIRGWNVHKETFLF